MRREIIVSDSFYENPEEVVAYAKSLAYYSPYAKYSVGSSDQEDMRTAPWITSRFISAKKCPFKSSQDLIEKLEALTGETIDREHWNKDFPENPDGSVRTPRPDTKNPALPPEFDNLIPGMVGCRWNCAFTFKFHSQPLGTGIHNHTRDTWNSVGEDGWTGLVYLNREAPRDAGLKLWKNKHGEKYEWMSEPERWQLLDEFANIYNRLILVRGSIPHSGGSGFGSTMEDARLFQSFFFKTIPPYSIDDFAFKPLRH